MHLKPTLSLIGSLLLLSAAPTASAIPITGGNTGVLLTVAEALTDLGLEVTPLGTATIGLDETGEIPLANFPITGGNVDDDTGQAVIEHEGSGLQLAAGDISMQLENFLISTTDALLTGLVSINNEVFAEAVPLLNIGADLSVSLTAEAAGAISQVFGVEADLTGLPFGVAAPAPITAPPIGVAEPPLALLLGAGLALLLLQGGFLARLRQRLGRAGGAGQPHAAGLAAATNQ